jgi:membrane-bound serine protease (ClpP class)
VLGLALLGAEIFVASGGILGIGGAVAFLLGGLLLIDDTQAPFLEVSRPLIWGITIGLTAFVLFALQAVMRTRRRPAYIGGNDVIGQTAVVRGPNQVFMHGELWRAKRADEGDASALEQGSHVRVLGRRGLDLLVAPEESVNGEEEKTWKS